MQTETPSPLALLQNADTELRSAGDHDWYRQFDDMDPFTATRDEIDLLRRTAPTPFAKGYLTGLMIMRQQPAPLQGAQTGWCHSQTCAIAGPTA
jgi:hypothetical protein